MASGYTLPRPRGQKLRLQAAMNGSRMQSRPQRTAADTRARASSPERLSHIIHGALRGVVEVETDPRPILLGYQLEAPALVRGSGGRGAFDASKSAILKPIGGAVQGAKTLPATDRLRCHHHWPTASPIAASCRHVLDEGDTLRRKLRSAGIARPLAAKHQCSHQRWYHLACLLLSSVRPGRSRLRPIIFCTRQRRPTLPRLPNQPNVALVMRPPCVPAAAQGHPRLRLVQTEQMLDIVCNLAVAPPAHVQHRHGLLSDTHLRAVHADGVELQVQRRQRHPRWTFGCFARGAMQPQAPWPEAKQRATGTPVDVLGAWGQRRSVLKGGDAVAGASAAVAARRRR
mmetsp:Transcript_60270/g.118542  ORF Transcript_60270/g.118542 Transcript_60270/m.118542 type:complete len:343 (+) Transcript_60270:142-1170(+)